MSKSPSLTPKDVISLLEQRGFQLKRINGTHYYYVHPESKKLLWSRCITKICRNELYWLS